MNNIDPSRPTGVGCWSTFCAWISPLFRKITDLFRRIFCCAQATSNQDNAPSLKDRANIQSENLPALNNSSLSINNDSKPLEFDLSTENHSSASTTLPSNEVKPNVDFDLSNFDLSNQAHSSANAPGSSELDVIFKDYEIDQNGAVDLQGEKPEEIVSEEYSLRQRIASLNEARSVLDSPPKWLSPVTIDACLQIIYSNPALGVNLDRFYDTTPIPKDERAAEEQEQRDLKIGEVKNWYKWNGLDQDAAQPTSFVLISDVSRGHWFCCLADHEKKKVYVFDSFSLWNDRVECIQKRTDKMGYGLVKVQPNNLAYSKLQGDGYSCGLWCVLFADFYKQYGIGKEIDDKEIFDKFVEFYKSKQEQPGMLASYRKEMCQKVNQELESAKKMLCDLE